MGCGRDRIERILLLALALAGLTVAAVQFRF
jgi:hypothetical protein